MTLSAFKEAAVIKFVIFLSTQQTITLISFHSLDSCFFYFPFSLAAKASFLSEIILCQNAMGRDFFYVSGIEWPF